MLFQWDKEQMFFCFTTEINEENEEQKEKTAHIAWFE